MNDSRFQMALAHDPQFLNRIQFLMSRVALQVAGEDPATANHAARRAFASQVLGNPGTAATAAAVALVGAVNLTVATTTITADLSVVTDATDAAIENQIATLWSAFAGV